MNNYCIYKHINKINNKVYIGQTCQKPEYRWNHGQGYKQCPVFYQAIQKYGWDNFEHIILETGLSLEQANEKQQYYIKLYNSTDIEFGYNMQLGGNDRVNISEQTRQKLSSHAKQMWQSEEKKSSMSEMMKLKWQDEEYKQKQKESRQKALNELHKEGKTSFISDDGKKRISEARKQYIKQHGTPTQGKGHSLETRKKLSEQKIGNKNPMYGKTMSEQQKQLRRQKSSKKVKCIETGEVFSSRKAAAEWCGLKSGSSIVANINGRKKSAGKHPQTKQPLHWENVD